MNSRQAEKFIEDVERIFGGKELMARTDRELRVVALDLYGRITRDTPVDTGYLRATWRLARGAPDSSLPAPFPEGTKRSEAELRVAEASNEASFGPDPQVRDIWITTAADYALPIEYGRSKVKAPRGMVRKSLAYIVAKYSV